VLDINAAGLELFRFKDIQEARSVETIHQLFWDARDGGCLIELLTDAHFVKDYEISLVNRDGDHLYGLITANLTMDEDGRPSGVEGTIRDITQRKRLEKELARTEKLAAVGQLAAGLAQSGI
jgi:PAS domain S-box-containing protein